MRIDEIITASYEFFGFLGADESNVDHIVQELSKEFTQYSEEDIRINVFDALGDVECEAEVE